MPRSGPDLLEPFRRDDGRPSRALVAAFVLVNAITLINAILHHPHVMYDPWGHIGYYITLSEGRLPGPDDTAEFFCPPLPYVFPAMLEAGGLPEIVTLKANQLLGALIAGLTAWYMLRLARRLERGGIGVRLAALFLLGIIAGYHRMFVFVRGEPMVALFCMMLIDYALRRVHATDELNWRDGVVMGLLCGALALSRQWGLLVCFGVAGWAVLEALRQQGRRWLLLRVGVLTLVIGTASGGWYYLHLWAGHDNPLAFNREPENGKTPIKPAGFFWHPVAPRMLDEPFVHRMPPRLIPIAYAEMWGDYYLAWLAQGRWPDGTVADGHWLTAHPSWYPWTNLKTMGRYLGRVNIAAVAPSLVLIAGVGIVLLAIFRHPLRKRAENEYDAATRLLSLAGYVTAVSIAGYVWFIHRYPTNTGDTVKASYMLHLMPLAALGGGYAMHLARGRFGRRPMQAVWAVLIIAAIHNAPTLMTRYLPPWYGLFPRQFTLSEAQRQQWNLDRPTDSPYRNPAREQLTDAAPPTESPDAHH